jgi:hypothetical protein
MGFAESMAKMHTHSTHFLEKAGIAESQKMHVLG